MDIINPILRKAGTHLAQSVRPDNSKYSLKVALWETIDRYEIYEMEWPNEFDLPSHYHHKGIETFYIVEGGAEVLVAGKTFTMEAGDLIHTPRYIPHAFTFRSGTKILSLFQDMHYFNKEGGAQLFWKNIASEDFEPSAQFKRDKSIRGDSYLMEFAKTTEDQNYHYLRRKDEQLLSYKDGKLIYNLKVPQWETDGNGEIWEIVWEKDAQVEMHMHYLTYDSLYVMSGSIEVNEGDQVYVVEKGDYIHIRPNTPHSLKSLSSDTKTLNLTLNVDPQSQSVLQKKMKLEALKKTNPELLEDDEYIKDLQLKNDFHVI